MQDLRQYMKGYRERPPGDLRDSHYRVARDGVSHRHQAVAEALLTNPDKTLRDIGAHFGYSENYFYMLVRSHAFQDYYQALLGRNLDERVLPLRDQITGVASRALDKLGKALEAPDTPAEFYLDVANKMLQRSGAGTAGQSPAHGQSPALTQVNNYYVADDDRLQRARERMNAFYEQIEGEQNGPGIGPGGAPAPTAPAALSANPYGDFGAPVGEPTALDLEPAPAAESPWSEGGGAEVRAESSGVVRGSVRSALPPFPLD